MELRQLIDDLSQALQDAICEGGRDDDSHKAIVKTNDGEIEMYLTRDADGMWDLEIFIYHDNIDIEHDDANLETYLASNVEVDWDAVEESWMEDSMDVYQRNGFSSESDFWRWKEGRL